MDYIFAEKICCKGDKHSTSSVMSSETENKVVYLSFIVIFYIKHFAINFYFVRFILGVVFTTRADFTAMETAKNDCDWTVALLVGVFGEDAKLMRVYPRKPGLKKFPFGFLMLAQSKYTIAKYYLFSFYINY